MGPLFVTLFQTRSDTALDAQAVLDQIREDWGERLAEEFDEVGARTLTGDLGPGLSPDARVLSFAFDEMRIMVAPAQTQYDLDLDVEAAASVSPFWDSRRDLPDVNGPSLMVMAVPDATDDDDLEAYLLDEERDVVEEAMWVSNVTASLVACTDSVSAVYLPTSEQIAAPDRYREAALDVAPDLPLTMWVDFLVSEEAGVVTGETLGMSDLGLIDIEIDECELPGEDVVKVLVDAAVVLYDDGLVIGDGDIVESDGGNFTASIAASKYDPEQPVLRLSLVVAANRAQRRAAARKRGSR
ncbi:DUF4261 domain-containing protein [Gordonia aichiensis]|uniref:DUF4261 domain-containing protein n=1 Tax=Gordonia aichiensis TaxID=36820 RepID=UPI003263543F